MDLALFHKPVGVQSTVGDPWGRRSLSTVAEELLSAGLHPVGRLDAETDGLLLFARDGRVTQHLLHPKRAIPRVYVATVTPAPDPSALTATLAAGAPTSEGTFTAELRACDGDRVTLAVTEGRHRMVRRMLANAGHPVVALRRIAFGPFELGELAPRAWREPHYAERAWLEARLGGRSQGRTRLPSRSRRPRGLGRPIPLDERTTSTHARSTNAPGSTPEIEDGSAKSTERRRSKGRSNKQPVSTRGRTAPTPAPASPSAGR